MTTPLTSRSRSPRQGWMLRTALMAVAAACIAGLVAWGFVDPRGGVGNEAERESSAKTPVRVVQLDGKPVVKLDEKTREKSGIEVSELSPAPYQDQLRGYGTVLDLAQLIDLINSYGNAQAQQQIAQAKLAVSKTAFDRARDLYRNQQNVSLAQFQAAQAALQTDQATAAAAASQVRGLAATALQAFGPVVGKSLLEGSPLVTRLIERQDVLLQVTLPPGATLPSPPQTGTVQVEGGSSATATFVSPAARTDPRVQGVSFLYVAPANSGLISGLNVLVSLPSGPPSDGLSIPPSAIVWWQDRAWIYREMDADTFARTQVPTNLPSRDGGYVVIERVPGEARIVTQGAQLLLSEEFRAQIQVGDD